MLLLTFVRVDDKNMSVGIVSIPNYENSLKIHVLTPRENLSFFERGKLKL